MSNQTEETLVVRNQRPQNEIAFGYDLTEDFKVMGSQIFDGRQHTDVSLVTE